MANNRQTVYTDIFGGTSQPLNPAPAFTTENKNVLQSPLTRSDSMNLNRDNYNLTKDDFYFPGENPYTMTSVPSQEKAPIMADQKPHQHKQHRPSPTARKLAVYIINVIAGLMCLFVFVMTCMQFGNNEKTSQGSTLFVIGDSSQSACDVIPHRPLRFRFVSDPEYLYCGWLPKVSVGRFFLSLFGVFWVIIGFYSSMKNKKYLLWLFCGLSAVLSLCNFIMMCVDASDVNNSNTWCKGGMEGMQLSGETECNFLPYTVTCLADVLAFAAWLGVCIASFRYIKSVAPAS